MTGNRLDHVRPVGTPPLASAPDYETGEDERVRDIAIDEFADALQVIMPTIDELPREYQDSIAWLIWKKYARRRESNLPF